MFVLEGSPTSAVVQNHPHPQLCVSPVRLGVTFALYFLAVSSTQPRSLIRLTKLLRFERSGWILAVFLNRRMYCSGWSGDLRIAVQEQHCFQPEETAMQISVHLSRQNKPRSYHPSPRREWHSESTLADS